MTARKLRGLNALRDATVQAPPAIHVLAIDGIPRTGLTPREVAEITKLPYRRILDQINAGRIRVISCGNREYVIPVSELAEISRWASYLDPTA